MKCPYCDNEMEKGYITMHAASLGEKNDMNLHGYPKRVMEFNYHEHLQVL